MSYPADVKINTFAPGAPHEGQKQVLAELDKGTRFVLLRAGRKWRKTSMMISWLAEQALTKGLPCPYIAPSKVQAKNIVWTDHIGRLRDELKSKKIPYKVNELELSISFPGGGKIQLFGVENAESLRGISNWGAVAMDEYDDWTEDIWPLIIRPNILPNRSPALVGGTPKGFRNLYKLESGGIFKPFHFRSHDNPELSKEELKELVKEYKELGMDYYRQEILAKYVKPYGIVYGEWPVKNYREFDYNPDIPLHLSIDFGVNDATAIIWIQKNGGEYRVIDYYEASNADIGHFVQVIRSKPYQAPDLVTGDPAGVARSITTNTSPVDEYRKRGIFIRTKAGVKIPEQIRVTHRNIKSLFINSGNPNTERFKDCLLNYKYPTKKSTQVNQSNEIPIHDEFSHAMRALEYYFVNIDNFQPNQISTGSLPQFSQKKKWQLN